MSDFDYIIMGGAGLVGNSFVKHLEKKGANVLSLTSRNFEDYCKKKISTNFFINANGNSFKFKANKDPFWDFDKSVLSMLQSLKSFKSQKYVFFSSIDVYSDTENPKNNHEEMVINSTSIDYYGSNKYFAESILKKYHEKFLIFRLGSVVSPVSKKGPLYDLSKKNLYIDQDSYLSLIDIKNIHKAYFELEALGISREIYNLTGTGNVSVKSIIKKYDIPVQSNSSAEFLKTHNYNISNKKLSKIVPLDTSLEISNNFFNSVTL